MSASYYITTAAGIVWYFYPKATVGRGWPRIWCVSYDTCVVRCCDRPVCCRRVVRVLTTCQHEVLWCCPLVDCCSCTAAQPLLMFMLNTEKGGNYTNIQRVNLLLCAHILLGKNQETCEERDDFVSPISKNNSLTFFSVRVFLGANWLLVSSHCVPESGIRSQLLTPIGCVPSFPEFRNYIINCIFSTFFFAL